jgi:hypothetical protein
LCGDERRCVDHPGRFGSDFGTSRYRPLLTGTGDGGSRDLPADHRRGRSRRGSARVFERRSDHGCLPLHLGGSGQDHRRLRGIDEPRVRGPGGAR